MTISITATVLGSVPPQVRLDVTSSPVVTGPMTIVRIHADGSEHRVLGVGSLIETWAGVDLHAPGNEPVTYRATVGVQTATSAPVLMLSDAAWLVHQSDPDLAVLVDKIMSPMQDVRFASRATRYDPLSGGLPVFRTDMRRGGETGQIVIKCPTREDRDAVKALIADDTPLLLSTPWAEYHWMWVHVGDVTISNPAGQEWYPARMVTLPYEECAAPDADAGVWTLDELDAHAVTAYPTLADLDAAYAGLTLADLDLRAI